MKIRFAIFLLITTAAATASYATAVLRASQDQSAHTTWDGIYTKEQAQKGEAIYSDKCEKCHGPNGAGADAPSLAGGEFASDWDSMSVGQLFDRIRVSMPQDNPQSLSREDVSALLAFIFSKNSFPAGQTDVPTDGTVLGQIKYMANKP
jgi:mono/diheme cytochrome c family protein